MASSGTTALVIAERKELQKLVSDAKAQLVEATKAHDAALQAYAAWQARLVNAINASDNS